MLLSRHLGLNVGKFKLLFDSVRSYKFHKKIFVLT